MSKQKSIEEIMEDISYEGAKIGSPVTLELYLAIKKALQSERDKAEEEFKERIKNVQYGKPTLLSTDASVGFDLGVQTILKALTNPQDKQ